MTEFLSMRDAGRRVRRSRRTIRRWMSQGMPFEWIDGRKFVELDVLLATLRTKISAKKSHQYRKQV
ncbi:hypothetical protein [Subtercola sp. YIM 133946]|uniref:hypothetical protein n=1 Tax=Subtercola sp. YIM 133946 TaxID=3118909 RepID=UPI002F952BAB